jgi:integrase
MRPEYKHAWSVWTEWCEKDGRQVEPATPDDVIEWMHQCAEDLSHGTIALRISALNSIHKQRGMTPPSHDYRVTQALQAIRKAKPESQPHSKPITARQVRAYARAADDGPRGARNLAALTLGVYSGLEVQQLAALRWGALKAVDEGLVIFDASGSRTVVQYLVDEEVCPVRAVNRWKGLCQSDAVFPSISRHGKQGVKPISPAGFRAVVKECMEAAGFNPDHYAAHGLRSGHYREARARQEAAEKALTREEARKLGATNGTIGKLHDTLVKAVAMADELRSPAYMQVLDAQLAVQREILGH